MANRLLCIFAHPDDESYGPAGGIRKTAREGGLVRVVCATRGEAGSIGISKSYSPHNLGRVRQAEMLLAARVLEVETVFLGFPDRHVPEVPEAVALPLIVREIRLFRPQAILAFHPNGISGHPDHKAMTGLARAAFDAAADPAFPVSGTGIPAEPWAAGRLWYYALTRSRARAVEHFRSIEFIEETDVDLTLDVSGEVARKHEACLAHGTQRGFYQQLMGASEGIDRYWAVEHYALGAWSGVRPESPLTGFFAPEAGP